MSSRCKKCGGLMPKDRKGFEQICPKCKTKMYPCADCGKLRTKEEGGTTFTVCDECWNKHYKKREP